MSKAAELAALIGSGQAQGDRNFVINGAMQVAQRGTSFADPTDNTYSLDRMHIFNTNDGAFTVTQDTTVPSGEGFYKSIKFDCTTADGTIAAGQYATLSQRIEGLNNTVLGYGASGAKSIVVSFYAKSNLTGTFCYSVRNSAVDRAYIKEFSLTSANTWERISFTIPGDTSGTWLVDNGIGSNHQISLSMGSTFHGTANQWNSSNVVATSNQVNFLSSTDNNFFLTGWQVEVGDVATPFEHRSFADEMYRCRRYFYKSFNYATAPENGGSTGVSGNGGLLGYCGSNNSGIYSGVLRFDPEMRTTPTVVTYGNSSGHWGHLAPTNSGSISFSSGSGHMGNIKASGVNFGQNVSGNTLLIGFGHLTAEAEL